MDKFSIKLTLTSVTAPTLFPYLASIVDAKQRAHALRHMAELGYTAFLARQATHANGMPTQALAPAVPVPAASEAFASEDSAAWPSPAPATHSDAKAIAASDSSMPGGLPTAMAEHLDEAMARFFPT
ncbi:hypothetical protein [Ralstonia pseudosolanacearum]|uniref:hypothetical protein n=1 Tax=Ralstonia pseudosolanacearum TaxID=1310165 RepID=UPI003CE7AB18